jgi:hypothetical protein
MYGVVREGFTVTHGPWSDTRPGSGSMVALVAPRIS